MLLLRRVWFGIGPTGSFPWPRRLPSGSSFTADFVVSLSRATTGVVTMRYGTESDFAGSPSDYERTAGTLTFQPGETQKTISVPIVDDGATEPLAQEDFFMVLHTLKGATFASTNADGNGEAIGTIINAEPLTVSISDATATEGVDETIDFTISLNRATNKRLKVNVLFSSGTADASDIDLVNDQTSVTFEPGETEKTYSFLVARTTA